MNNRTLTDSSRKFHRRATYFVFGSVGFVGRFVGFGSRFRLGFVGDDRGRTRSSFIGRRGLDGGGFGPTGRRFLGQIGARLLQNLEHLVLGRRLEKWDGSTQQRQIQIITIVDRFNQMLLHFSRRNTCQSRWKFSNEK